MTRLPTALLMSTLLSAGFALSAYAQSTPAPQPATTASPQPAAPPVVTAPATPAAAPIAANDDAARKRSMAADRDAMFEAHLAALHAGLTLTPDQEHLWPPVEQAIRGFMIMRATLRDDGGDRMQVSPVEPAHKDPIAALKVYSDRMLDRAQALKALSNAADPLYAALSDDQKHRLPMLLHGLTPRFGPVARMVDRLDPEQDGPRGAQGAHGPRHRWDRDDLGDGAWQDDGWSGHRDGRDRRAGIDGDGHGGWFHHGWDRRPDEGPDAND